MSYIYSAIFEDNEQAQTCRITFPSLNYESEVPYTDKTDLFTKAGDELGFALWLREETEHKIPKPATINKEGLPSGAVIRFVACDYDKYKKGITVKEFDLSE